jgi:hypothetical protein
MKKPGTRHMILMLSLTVLFSTGNSQQGSFLLSSMDDCTLWWSLGTYQVKKSELPSVPRDVEITAAGNEYEPWQLVVHPGKKMENFRISAGLLSGDHGVIDPSHIRIYDVEYIYVKHPTSPGNAGWYPDPIPVNNGPRTLYPGENYPFFIDVYVPGETPPGIYKGEIILTWRGRRENVPYSLRVYGFTLPETTTLRSSFGIPTSYIEQYHNLGTGDELRQVYDLYMDELRKNRVCPTNPFSLYPMRVDFTGVKWTGGIFDGSVKSSGTYSYKVSDNSLGENFHATSGRIPVLPGNGFLLEWEAKSQDDGHQYAVSLRLYDHEGRWLIYDNILEVFTGDLHWKKGSIKIPGVPEEAAEAEVILHASVPVGDGSTTGTVWFDNVSFREAGKVENLLAQGDFEVNAGLIGVEINFDEFDKAGERYLDEFGFNAFHLPLHGMPGGSFHAKRYGIFGGFEQGTTEYNMLMKSYLSGVERHLREKGWLGREYVYWFDEPNEVDYPFVVEGMDILKNSAPGIKRFITEHRPPDNALTEVTDISCYKWDLVNPVSIDSLVNKGKEFWSYLCTGPKPPWVNLFLDEDAVNMRIWCWMSYQYKLTGILIWYANYWNSDVLAGHGQLQNPWDDPMAYVTSYGTPQGRPRHWGNGDGRLLYPPNRDINKNREKFIEGPVSSIRLAILREGIEDYEYFVILKNLRDNLHPRRERSFIERADGLLHFDETFFSSGKEYSKDPLILYKRRDAIARLIEEIKNR